MRSALERVPIPRRMAHLDRDRRGYPVPVIVMRDSEGRPHFAINDEGRRTLCLLEHTCSICGDPLDGPSWFVGGTRSAFHPDGAYADPPVHHECMRYAMRVCPHLAAPRYSKRIDAATLTEDTPVLVDFTQLAGRPEEDVFAGVLAKGFELLPHGLQLTARPMKPYIAVEFWRHGRQLPRSEGERVVERALGSPLPEMMLPPRIMIAGRRRRR